MKRILIFIVAFSLSKACSSQSTDLDFLKEIKENLQTIDTSLKKQNKTLDAILKKLNEKEAIAKKKLIAGYLSFKKDNHLKLYDNSDHFIEKSAISSLTDKKKEKLPDEERYEYILVDSIHVFMKDDKTTSLTLFYNDDMILNHTLSIEPLDFNATLDFSIATNQKIKLNEILSYAPVVKANIMESMVSLSPHKRTVGLTIK